MFRSRSSSSASSSGHRRRGRPPVSLLGWLALISAAAALGALPFWPEGSGVLILLSALPPLLLSGASLALAERLPRTAGTLPTVSFVLCVLACLPIALVGGLHLLGSAESGETSGDVSFETVMEEIVGDRDAGSSSDQSTPAERRARYQEMVRRMAAHYAGLSPEQRQTHLAELEATSPRRGVGFARELLLHETDSRLKVRLLRILDTHLSSTFAARYPEGPATRAEAEAISSEALTLSRDLWRGIGGGPVPPQPGR